MRLLVRVVVWEVEIEHSVWMRRFGWGGFGFASHFEVDIGGGREGMSTSEGDGGKQKEREETRERKC